MHFLELSVIKITWEHFVARSKKFNDFRVAKCRESDHIWSHSSNCNRRRHRRQLRHFNSISQLKWHELRWSKVQTIATHTAQYYTSLQCVNWQFIRCVVVVVLVVCNAFSNWRPIECSLLMFARFSDFFCFVLNNNIRPCAFFSLSNFPCFHRQWQSEWTVRHEQVCRNGKFIGIHRVVAQMHSRPIELYRIRSKCCVCLFVCVCMSVGVFSCTYHCVCTRTRYYI